MLEIRNFKVFHTRWSEKQFLLMVAMGNSWRFSFRMPKEIERETIKFTAIAAKNMAAYLALGDQNDDAGWSRSTQLLNHKQRIHIDDYILSCKTKIIRYILLQIGVATISSWIFSILCFHINNRVRARIIRWIVLLKCILVSTTTLLITFLRKDCLNRARRR